MQVTRNGGSWPQVSPDSKEVYYLAPDGVDVWKVASGGGQETRVLGPVWARKGRGSSRVKFAVVAEGIYFIETGPGFYKSSSGNSLKFFSFAKGTSKKVSDVKLQPSNGLSVSPDGRYVLAALIDPFVCDLMLVENFR